MLFDVDLLVKVASPLADDVEDMMEVCRWSGAVVKANVGDVRRRLRQHKSDE